MGLEPLPIALLAILAGAALLGAVWLGGRVYARRQKLTQTDNLPFTTPNLSPSTDAIIVARPHGQVLFANSSARQLFGANGNTPTLSEMARLVEPRAPFLELFAREGQAQLRIAESSIDASSVRLPSQDQTLFIIALREKGSIAELSDSRGEATVTVAALIEIGRIISASLNLNDTLRNTLAVVARVVPYDIAEITLWDSETEQYNFNYFGGEPAYVQVATQRQRLLQNPPPALNDWRSDPQRPLILNELQPNSELFTQAQHPFATLAALPLTSGPRLVGTLALASSTPEAYTPQDLELLEIIGVQAAIAIRNAQLYARQQRSLDELAGLVSVAQAASLISDPRELIARLSERIATLVGVEICGFLLYDSQQHALVAQTPFRGLPDAFVSLYRSPVPPNSLLESILNERQWWYSNTPQPDDPLANIREAAGIKTQLLVPLVVRGRRIGLLQASNKTDGTHFNDSDINLVQVLAGQAAALIDNSRLVRETEIRASRAEGARLVGNITAQAIPLDDRLRQALELVASLTDAELAAVYLIDPYSGDLIPHLPSVYGTQQFPADHAILRANDPGYVHVVAQTRRSFFTTRASSDRRIMPIYRRVQEFYGIESAIVVPLIVEDRTIGEMLVGSPFENGLRPEDVQLAEITAAQIASSIVRTELTVQTDFDLRQRADQLTSIARISRELNQTLDLETILKSVTDEAQNATHAKASIVVLTRSHETATPTPQRYGELTSNHPLNALEQQTISVGQSQMINDLAPADRLVPSARSALLVPISHQTEVVGLLHLYSTQRAAFDRNMLDYANILAAQMGIAVGNSQRYHEQLQRGDLLRHRADQLGRLLEISRNIRSDRPLADSLEAIALGIQETVGFNDVRISRLEPTTGALDLVATAGVPLINLANLPTQRLEELTPYLVNAFRQSESYAFSANNLATAWAAEHEQLITPLRGSRGETLGLLTVSNPRSGHPIDLTTIKSVEVFANQAALAIENNQLFDAADQRANELTQRFAELQDSYSELDRVNRSLQHKDKDLREAFEQIDRRASLLLAMHRITSSTGGLTEPQQAYAAITAAIVNEIGLDTCILLRGTSEQPQLMAGSGYDTTLNFTPMLAQHNPVQHVLTENLPVIVPELDKSGWRTSPLMQHLGLQSFVAVPVPWRDQQGCLLAGFALNSPHQLTNDHLDTLNLLANHIGITNENIGLYRELRTLQDLNQSVLQSIDQGLVVLNPQWQVLLANPAIYNLLPNLNNQVSDTAVPSLFQLAPELHSHELERKLTRVLEHSEPFQSLSLSYLTPDQTWRELDISGYALRQDNQVNGVVLLINDLSDRSELERTARERSLQLEALTKVSQVISSALRVEDVVALVLDQVDRVAPFDSANLWLKEGATLRLMAVRSHKEDDQQQPGLTMQLSESNLYQQMVRVQQPILIEDTQENNAPDQTEPSPYRSWLAVPLISKDDLLGALVLEKADPTFYRQHHVEMAQVFANQAAVALDNARLFEESWARALELNERTQRLARVSAASEQLGRSLDPAAILEIGLIASTDAIEADFGQAVLFEDRQGLGRVVIQYQRRARQASTPTPASTFTLNDYPLVDSLKARRQAIMADDVAATPQARNLAKALGATGVQAALFVPLVTGGQHLGMLALYDQHVQRTFAPADIDLTQTIANQLAVAYQNAYHHKETETQLAELETIYTISQSVTTTIDLPQLLADIRRTLAESLNAHSLYVALNHPESEEMSFPVFYENDEPMFVPRQPMGGLTGHILTTRQPLLINGQNTDTVMKTLGALHQGLPSKSYLGVPLLTGESVVGVLAVQDLEDPNAYDETHLRLLTTVAGQVAVAIENARLFNQSQQRLRESLALRQVTATISGSFEVNQILDSVVHELAAAFDFPFVRVYQQSGADLMVTAQTGYNLAEDLSLPIDQRGLLTQVIENRQALLLTDPASLPHNPIASPDVIAQIGIPLIVDAQVLGVLTVESESERPLTENDLALLQTFGQQVSIAIERAQLFTQLTRNAQELELRVAERTVDLENERDRVETLLRITTELSASLDLDRVLTKALTLVKDAISATQGSLFLLDTQSDRIIYRSALDAAKPLPPGGVPVPFERGEGLIGWVITKREATIIDNLDEDERWIHRPFSHLHKSALAVPLKAGEDLLGALIFYSSDYGAFNASQLNLVTAAASQVASAISNAELYRLIRDQAERLGSMLRANQIEVSKSRAVLESVVDGVLVADENGNAIVFNRAAEEILGLNRDAVIGRPTSDFLGVYGAAGQSWLSAINRWQETPLESEALEVLAERLVLEDNRIVSVFLSPVFNGDEFIGSVSLFRDITREVEVDRLKTEFVTTVSHELRTPMTSIKGFTDLLLMNVAGPMSDQQREFIAKIKANADRLKLLVEDLLDISKIESGKINLHRDSLDLAEVLRGVANHLEGRIHNEDKTLQIQVDLPEHLPPVNADRNRITQVLTNLTDNAFNYTPNEGKITITAKVMPNMVQIDITDTGIGLTTETQKRLFERFYRDDNPLVMATAGTGLGLNIVQRLVEMHGGRIWAESAGEDLGSTFSVQLPRADLENPPSPILESNHA